MAENLLLSAYGRSFSLHEVAAQIQRVLALSGDGAAAPGRGPVQPL
ncbi:MAG: hypothetical protein PHU77_14760 [Simplicispira sp.]|nr:hypothetical protein [Simplicispira sp.]